MADLPIDLLKNYEPKEIPEWVTGVIGWCPHCKKGNMLIFVLRNSEGQYLHCMICNKDFKENLAC